MIQMIMILNDNDMMFVVYPNACTFSERLSYLSCCLISLLPYHFQEFAGDLEGRERGSLISFETGAVTPFGVVAAQDRGLLIVPPKTEVRHQ
jgi:hypothetical protein